jgi:hypothetical protein
MGRKGTLNPLQGALIATALVVPQVALADEGGVSFWVPVTFAISPAAPPAATLPPSRSPMIYK